jgi:hypothetical protein
MVSMYRLRSWAFDRVRWIEQPALLNGVERKSGTKATLSSVNMRECIIGQDRLLIQQLRSGYTLGWLRQWDYPDCGYKCAAHRQYILESGMDRKLVGSLEPHTIAVVDLGRF